MIRELSVQAQSGTNSTGDIANLQLEANALIDEIGRVSEDTKYNGTALIGAEAKTLNIQVGVNDGDTIAITTYDVKAQNLGVMVVDTADSDGDGDATDKVLVALKTGNVYLDISQTKGTATAAVAEVTAVVGVEAVAAVTAVTAADAIDEVITNNVVTTAAVAAVVGVTGVDEVVGVTAVAGVTGVAATNAKPGALEVITGAIDQVAGYKASWGAGQNRLEYTVSNLMNVVEFTTAARSRIQDADFAQEAAKLAKAQVLQQTGAAMLAQANAAPQLALQLIK